MQSKPPYMRLTERSDSNWRCSSVEQAEPIMEHECLSTVKALDMTADGSMLAMGESDGIVTYGQTLSDSWRKLKCGAEVRGVSLSVEAGLLLSGDAEGHALVWNIKDGRQLHDFECGSAVNAVEFARTGEAFAVACQDGHAALYSVNNGRIQTFQCDAAVSSIDLSHESKLLATGDFKKTATLWHAETGTLVRVFVCQHNLYSVRLSSDNALLATGDAMCKARVWDVATGEALRTLDCNGWCLSVCFSSCGKLLLTGEQHSHARLWNVDTGELVHQLGCGSAVPALALSVDKTRLATASGNTVTVWESAPGGVSATMSCGAGDVNALDVSGSCLAVGGPGKVVTVWHADGQVTHRQAQAISVRMLHSLHACHACAQTQHVDVF